MARTIDTLGDPSNGAHAVLETSQPYTARIVVEGSAALLFHRWNVDEIAAKAVAAKGSKAKKTDNVESYVYRNAAGELAVPGEYFRQSIIGAAKFRQDPRSPRKSAMDLFKAGVAVLDEYCSLGCKEWDYLDRRRVMVQRAGVTRVRPAMMPGWRTTVTLTILLPEYITPPVLHGTVSDAGRLVGVGEFRPTFGRFQVVGYEIEG